MRFSLNWLKELCDVEASTEDIAARLTSVGFEVEGITDLRAQWEHILVVEVSEVTPHPQADKLKVVRVLDGEGTRSIVCGAPNVVVGMRVPLAEPGAVVGGKKIESAKLRGVQSDGMLCSERELGLSDDHGGLMELPADWALGRRLADTPLGDTLLEIGITPNRPDAMSHLGMARELAAAFSGRIKKPRVLLREDGGDVGERVGVEIQDASGCKRYLARCVVGVKQGPSPLLVRARLNTLGTRSINNIVDATNWVMLELGHPLHAFDLGRLQAQSKQKKIFVRKATEGETLKTLDGQERKLVEEDLVIADASRGVALAGVMGGENSEITDSTSDVLVESAWFEPNVVYKTGKRLALMTEAANRFWRGTDIDGLQAANDRVCGLLAEWCGGKVCRGTVDVYPRRKTPTEISLRPKRLADYLGVTVSVEDIAKWLTALELNVKGRTDQALTFSVPTFRVDLNAEVDLIEEVARCYGYANIPERLPEAGGVYMPVGSDVPDLRRIRDLVASLGMSEAINYSFVDARDEQLFRPVGVEAALKLANPMSETENTMRTSLVPGLMRNAARNVSRQQLDVRLFEIGRVFRPRTALEKASDQRDQKLPVEEQRLAAVLHGAGSPFGWGTPVREVDFFDMKRLTEALFEMAGVRVDYVPENLPAFLHPGAAARLMSGQQDYGWVGQVHPATVAALGMDGSYFAAEIDLAVVTRDLQPVRYRHLPRFPGVRRDVALVAKDSVRAGSLIDFARQQATVKAPALEQVQLFDVYQGKPIPKGHSSLALAFFFRDQERTLTDAEVQGQFDALIAGLRSEFGVEVREGAGA